MGHGTEHEANSTYAKLQDVLTQKGYNDYIIGTVEAEPSLDEVRNTLSGMNVEKVVLLPLMIVAGDHANNDIAGDEEDSWKVVLTEDGYAVETVLEGLGQFKGIQDLLIKHTQAAMERGEIVFAGKYSAPDYEMLLAKNCGLAIESTMLLHTPEVKEKLELLGIPVMVDYQAMSRAPSAGRNG